MAVLKVKTFLDRAADDDGYRLLITREWPARLSASGADGFNPQLAPSAGLYAGLLGRTISYDEFGLRYMNELDLQKERLAKLKEQADEFDITLVTYPNFEGKSIGKFVLEKCGAMPADNKKSAKVVIEEYAQKMAQKEGKNMKKENKIEKKKTTSVGFRFLEHTADIKVEAWAPDFCGALKQSALAMFSVLGSGTASERMEIEERAADREQLVVGLLSRILAECDARERLACSIEMNECGMNPPHVKAVVGLARTRPKDAIKAVTYHQLEVEEKKNKCTIRVVFDV